MTVTLFYAFLFVGSMLTMINALTKNYPEVIPGPGLPSLEELGLTSEDLYTKPLPPLINTTVEISHKEARGAQAVVDSFGGFCETTSTGNVDNIIACFNYLNAFENGQLHLTVQFGSTYHFCSAGDAQVIGTTSQLADMPWVIASGPNVALGLQWIFTYCNKGGRVGGYQVANGNNLFIVGASAYTAPQH
jgi:hypothetical protein